MAGMEYALQHERRPLTAIHPADYNPRISLKPSDPEYQNIERSLREFGYVDPIIINRDGTIIGGHQRAAVLKALGEQEIDVIVLDLSKQDEKALNIALNKVGGEWDEDLLRAALSDLKSLDGLDILSATGYTEPEIDIILGDALAQPEEKPDPDTGLLQFVFSLEQYADLQQALTMIGQKYKKKDMETFGNVNKTGNRLYMVVKEWAERKKLKSE